jgi:hypothetical protein
MGGGLMPETDVKAYLNQLRQALPYVPPIPIQQIKALHRKKDFGAIVRLIRSTMNVNVRLTLHWTDRPASNGHKQAPAWITVPENMPYYGTPAFRELKLDVSILKSFAANSTYQEFAITVAHELSHVVLDSIKHPLRREEKAVDLTAMLLGFSYLYRTAAHSVKRVDSHTIRTTKLGYLSPDELEAASRILIPTPMRAKRIVFEFLRENVLVIFLVAAGGSVPLLEALAKLIR